jgi:hypothetical protein
MDHHQQTRTAQRSRASLIVMIVLAFLLMGAAVVLVVSLPDDVAWQLPTLSTADSSLDVTGFACSAAEAQMLYPFAEGIMKLSGSRVAFLNIQGNEQYAVEMDFAAPFAVQNDTLFLAADRDGHAYVMLDAGGERFRGTLAGRINGASLSPEGYLAIIQDQSNSTGVVTLFAPDTGNKLFDCYFPESGYVLSVAFPPAGGCFDVALVNTAAAAARPIIKRFSMDGQPLGQRLPDLTELYPLIAYDAAGRPVLCGAANLAALTYEQENLIWQRRFQQILAVRGTPAGLLVLATDVLDGPVNLHCLNQDGKDQYVLAAGDALAGLAVAGDRFAVASGIRISLADSRSGAMIREHEVSAEIIRIGFSGHQKLTVVTRNGVHQLKLSK